MLEAADLKHLTAIKQAVVTLHNVFVFFSFIFSLVS